MIKWANAEIKGNDATNTPMYPIVVRSCGSGVTLIWKGGLQLLLVLCKKYRDFVPTPTMFLSLALVFLVLSGEFLLPC